MLQECIVEASLSDSHALSKDIRGTCFSTIWLKGLCTVADLLKAVKNL